MLPVHAGLSDAAAHLHQAVEAPTMLPRAAPAVGIEADVDQARGEFLPLAGAVTEAFQGVGTVAMQQDIGLLEQVFKYLALAAVVQVQARAAFAEGDFRNYTGFVPVRWIDAQHIGAQAREESAGNGAGQHAGQVQYLDARQGLRDRALPGWRTCAASGWAINQRFCVDRYPLGVRLPGLP
ncbi:hypothetical protein D3C80_1377200 [compost metagenome]